MACPHARDHLGHLPGKKYDRVARHLRDSFLKGEVDFEIFIRDNFEKVPQTHQEHFELKVKSYATASIVIDQLWQRLKEHDLDASFAEAKARSDSPNHYIRVLDFMIFAIAEFDKVKLQLVEEIISRTGSNQTRTQADEFAVCFWAVARHRHPELGGLPVPSMNDLIVFFGRMAMIAPYVFERDVGRSSTQVEYIGMLRHPYMLRLCVEMMSEDRMDLHPIFPLLTDRGNGNLNDLGQVFNLQHFEIRDENGTKSLQIKNNVMAEYCAGRAARATQSEQQENAVPHVLGCPALYTGNFREMYDWTVDLFERWYIA